MSRINPYYAPEKLNLDMVSYDKSSGSYEYDTICFWATPDGRVFTACDSGCSCPTPFEGYEGKDLEEVVAGLERVGSVEQGMSIIESWQPDKKSDYQQRISDADVEEFRKWLTEKLKS